MPFGDMLSLNGFKITMVWLMVIDDGKKSFSHGSVATIMFYKYVFFPLLVRYALRYRGRSKHQSLIFIKFVINIRYLMVSLRHQTEVSGTIIAQQPPGVSDLSFCLTGAASIKFKQLDEPLSTMGPES